MTTDSATIAASLMHSIETAVSEQTPYPHWYLTSCLPADVAEQITALPFPAPALDGLSGKRELHNATRTYFDTETRQAYACVSDFADAFQSPEVTKCIATSFGANLTGTYLRLEYAQDVNGFWLEPHTDLGVKAFTMLLYLSTEPSHSSLGTDIYDDQKRHYGRSPFTPNGAMIFVPSTNTYHGFEERPIKGVRKSVIINYVTEEWRAREQLSFPDEPIEI